MRRSYAVRNIIALVASSSVLMLTDARGARFYGSLSNNATRAAAYEMP